MGIKKPPTKSKLGPDPQALSSVVKLMRDNGLVELDWQDGTQRLHLKTAGAASVPVAAFAPQTPAVTTTPAAAPKAASGSSAATANWKPITSPFVGTFYRSSSPGSSPFVGEGSRIKAGDTLCIVEAMKLMNEIEAEFGGTIRQILVENGQPIEFGEKLFMVEV